MSQDSLNALTQKLADALDTICFQVKHGFIHNKDDCIKSAREILAEYEAAKEAARPKNALGFPIPKTADDLKRRGMK